MSVPDENDFFMADAGLKRIEFDFKLLLLQHLNNISRLVSIAVIPKLQTSAEGLDPDYIIQTVEKIITENLLLSVNMLESLLLPYRDDEFSKELDNIGRLNSNDYFKIRIWSIDKLGILMKLMDRKDLLLEKTKSVKV